MQEQDGEVKFEVYDVWRTSPAGDVSLGLFLTEKSAVERAAVWDALVKSKWDRAIITKRKVRE